MTDSQPGEGPPMITEIMASPVFSCLPSDTLASVAGLMRDRDVGCAPVVDEGGRVVGMITDRDISAVAYTRGLPLSQIEVATAMSSTVLACSSRQTLAEAETIMRRGRVRRTPVIDDAGQLVGIISLNDLARVSKPRRTDGIGAEVLGQRR
jgi:CBS domain-containing protein